jgi:hypothetical protein
MTITQSRSIGLLRAVTALCVLLGGAAQACEVVGRLDGLEIDGKRVANLDATKLAITRGGAQVTADNGARACGGCRNCALGTNRRT